MKTAHVQIQKENYDKWFEFDNVISRDEIEHEVCYQNPTIKQLYKDDKVLRSNDFVINWYEGRIEEVRARLQDEVREAEVANTPKKVTKDKADAELS